MKRMNEGLFRLLAKNGEIESAPVDDRFLWMNASSSCSQRSSSPGKP
jgi:hypothetical protein